MKLVNWAAYGNSMLEFNRRELRVHAVEGNRCLMCAAWKSITRGNIILRARRETVTQKYAA